MLRDIEVFRAIMTSGSTSKAAALLGISQPAVSQSLRKLETQAGLSLFERVRGRLNPTPEARAFLQEVDRSFVGLDLLMHRLQSLRQFGVGRLLLACYPALGMGFAPRCLARHLAQSSLSVSLQIMGSRDVRERLLSGQCDIGLMADESSTAGIEHHVFAQVDGVLVMGPGHPLASRAVIAAQDLRDQAFLSLNPEDMARKRLEQVLATHDVTLASIVETPYGATICEMALLGLGVGLVNPVTALPYLDRGLVARRFALKVSFTCIVGVPAGRPMSGEARLFMRTMREQLDDDLERITMAVGATVGTS